MVRSGIADLSASENFSVMHAQVAECFAAGLRSVFLASLVSRP
jgi:hypothetical protein